MNRNAILCMGTQTRWQHDKSRTRIMEPLTLSVNDAAKVLGVSSRTVWALITDGKLPAVKLGKRTLIRHADLQTFAARLGVRDAKDL